MLDRATFVLSSGVGIYALAAVGSFAFSLVIYRPTTSSSTQRLSRCKVAPAWPARLTLAMPGPDRASETFGIFHVEELVSTAGDLRVYLARDEHVDRRVLLRVAGEASAGVLLDDARRLAAVSHPGLVAVLGAHRSETGAYAAVQEVDARPLSECGPLSSEHGGRIAIDIAGAIDALARAGLRTPINPATVLVVSTHDGVRGLLDPLRALSLGVSSLCGGGPCSEHLRARRPTRADRPRARRASS